MAAYLLQVSYRPEGVAGLLKEGATKRRAAVQEMVEKAGGRLQAFYYAFGDADIYSIVEFPNHSAVAAVSLTVNASGAAKVRTTVLLTPEEVDAAGKTSVSYRAPGA